MNLKMLSNIKYNFIFILLLISIQKFTFCQSNKELFYNSVDYINCKMIELSIKDNKEKLLLINKYKQKFECKIGVTIFIDSILNFIDNESLSATLALSNEVNKIKEEYRKNWTKNYIINFLTNEIYNSNKYLKIKGFDNIEKHPEINTLKSQLNNEILKYINKNFDINELDKTNIEINESISKVVESSNKKILKLENRIKNLEKILSGKEESVFKENIIPIVLLIVILFLFFLIISKNVKTNERIDRRLSKKEFNDKIQELTNNNRNIESKIKEIVKGEIEKFQQKKIPKSEETRVIDQSIKQELVKKEFYLPAPNKDGSFKDLSKSDVFKPTASVYKLIILDNSDTIGEFSFIDDLDTMKRAINLPDSYILPVCDSQNAHDFNARKIITIENGKAQKDGDIWKVTKKVIIKYE